MLDIAARLRPSPRGELEITDVNREYLRRQQLRVCCFSRGFAWLDTGTHESLMQASNFIQAIEQRQGLKVACIEEVAYHKQFITAEQLLALAAEMNNGYGDYLRDVLEQSEPGHAAQEPSEIGIVVDDQDVVRRAGHGEGDARRARTGGPPGESWHIPSVPP